MPGGLIGDGSQTAVVSTDKTTALKFRRNTERANKGNGEVGDKELRGDLAGRERSGK